MARLTPHHPAARIAFANQLRGLAALGVVLVHYTVVYPLMRPMVGWVVAAPAYDGPVPAVAGWLGHPLFDLGAFGVALFFLLSGFVIPFSLHGTTAPRFLLARALRIFPTFWAGLALQAGAVALSGAWWGRPAAFGWRDYVLNGLLLNTLSGAGSVDWVSWTLCIEAKFYLLMALLRRPVLAHQVGPLLFTAASCLALVLLAPARLPPQLLTEAACLPVLLIGVLFHFHGAGALRTHWLVANTLVLGGVVALCWAVGPDRAAFAKLANYGYALAVFATCYAARRRFGRSWLLDALAANSYPLYLIHSVFGFAVLSFLAMGCRLPYALAAPLAFAASLAAAAALHRAVERPATRAGRRVAAGYRWPNSPAAEAITRA